MFTSVTTLISVRSQCTRCLKETNPAKAHEFAYDRTDQLTAATHRTTDASPTILKRYGWAYDKAGNRTTEVIDNTATAATYDGMNRLTGQQPGGAILLRGSTDEAASVTVQGQPAHTTSSNTFAGPAQVGSGTSTVVVQATDPTGNVRTNTYEISQSGPSTSYTYDANGNLTGDGTKTYVWDAENRLVEVKEGSTTLASFVYDGQGRRFSKTAGGVTTTFVYDGAQFLESRTSPATTRYVYDIGIDRPLAHVVSTTATYYIADHLGSIVATTDAAGDVTVARDYDAWGHLLPSTGGYAFTGREWDSETGLYYYRARYYDPRFARFLSEDPVEYLNGLSEYHYVLNNPAKWVDPKGWGPCFPDCPPEVVNAYRKICDYFPTNPSGFGITDAYVVQCIRTKCRQAPSGLMVISCNDRTFCPSGVAGGTINEWEIVGGGPH